MATRTPRSNSPSSSNETNKPAPWFLRRPMLVLLIATPLVYYHLFSAGFIAFDDNIHVYANPFLNPPTLQSVARLWQHAYEELYVPLAYTIYATVAHWAQVSSHTDSSIGQLITVDPVPFHVVSVAFHLANTLLCYLLVTRLTRRTTTALVTSLVFAVHPLQVESVAWISELRGLASGCFALLALNVFIRARQEHETSSKSRAWLAVSALLVICAMLCKPSAATLPLVALAIDRTILGTPWRKAVTIASLGTCLVIPLVFITRSVQGIPTTAQSVWWQRPFVAGDALAFYLFKVVVPTNLCVDYGRTPRLVMSHAWGYLAWMVPVCLLVICYWNRQRRPLGWLGVQVFALFLLPTLGLVPFSYQAYSTVADRYAYLALIGAGLSIAEAVDYIKQQTVTARVIPGALLALALLAFHQSRYWADSSELLRHTVEVNPEAAFAYNNLGDTELANGNLSAALSDYAECVRRDPTRVKAYINLAEVHSALNHPTEAEDAISRAVASAAMTADDFSNLGVVLMKMNQPDRALRALSTATDLEPNSPTHAFNLANALSAVGQFDKAEATYRRCISLAPTLANAHMGLGIVLAERHRLGDAVAEFRAALRLQPDDPATLDNLKRAEGLLATGNQ